MLLFFGCFHIAACFGAWDLGPQHGFARNTPWTLHKGPEKVYRVTQASAGIL